jgi:hypothetical protein
MANGHGGARTPEHPAPVSGPGHLSKTCVRCGETKPMDGFKNRKDSKDGRRNDCRRCSMVREELRRKQPAVKAKMLAAQSARRKRNYDPLANKNGMLRWRFGITLKEYDAMLAEQSGGCAICGGVDTRALAVDHDHQTGQVRALLCGPCNTGIGHLGDDPKRILAAAAYLLRYKKIEVAA